MKVLFVCSMNKWRSRTAEEIYRRNPELEVRSCGTSARARRRLSRDDVAWAEIIVMENKHRSRILADYARDAGYVPIHVLDVEDRYRYMDPELVAELQAAIDPILFAD
jgi:predicted protein tyrosine phosphatase